MGAVKFVKGEPVNEFPQGQHWYCLRSQIKREHLAAKVLKSRWELEVCLPRISHRKKTARGPVRFVEPLFPGYLFAQFDAVEHLRVVRSTEGVSGLVHFNGKVIPVGEEVIRGLQSLAKGKEVIEIQETFQPGEEVEVAEGTFAGIRALVKVYYPAKERVRVLLEFLGRETEVDLPATSVIAGTHAVINTVSRQK